MCIFLNMIVKNFLNSSLMNVIFWFWFAFVETFYPLLILLHFKEEVFFNVVQLFYVTSRTEEVSTLDMLNCELKNFTNAKQVHSTCHKFVLVSWMEFQTLIVVCRIFRSNWVYDIYISLSLWMIDASWKEGHWFLNNSKPMK